MKYHIVTYGCQMNVHESEKIAGFLRAAATLMMLHAHMAHFTFTEVLTGTLLPEYFSTLAVSPLVQAVVWISLKAFHRTRAERTDTPSDL